VGAGPAAGDIIFPTIKKGMILNIDHFSLSIHVFGCLYYITNRCVLEQLKGLEFRSGEEGLGISGRGPAPVAYYWVLWYIVSTNVLVGEKDDTS